MAWDPPLGGPIPDSPPQPSSSKQGRPGVSRPGRPPEQAELLTRMVAQPSTVAAFMVRSAQRQAQGAEPVGAVEQSVFKALGVLPAGQLALLRDSCAAVWKIDDRYRGRLLDLATLTSTKELTASFLAHRLVDEGLAVARATAGEPPPGGPVWRPITRRLVVGDVPGTLTAPFPVVCDIEGVRTSSFVPKPDAYRPDEIAQSCTYSYDRDTKTVSSHCVPESGNCRAGAASDGSCLRIVEVRPGSPVTLHGVNLGDDRTRVRLTGTTSLSQGFDYLLPASGAPDRATPLRDPDGNLINDCRVHDTLRFQVPAFAPNGVDETRPGYYRLDVEVPNDTHAGVPGPTDWLSTSHLHGSCWIHLLPAETDAYRVWVDELHCTMEEADEPGSDEISLLYAVANFPGDTDHEPVVRIVKTPLSALQDVSEGFSYPVDLDLLGHGDVGAAVPVSVVLALVGYEIDSEDALTEALDDWTDAFRHFFTALWDSIKGHISEIISTLAGLGLAGLIVAGIALVVVLLVGIIWAAWAPPDLVMFDTISLTASQLWSMTYLTTPLPAAQYHTIHGEQDDPAVRVRTQPASKLGYLYTEWRWYSEYQRHPIQVQRTSEYGLRYRFQRRA